LNPSGALHELKLKMDYMRLVLKIPSTQVGFANESQVVVKDWYDNLVVVDFFQSVWRLG
jgi:hypothetical protein